MFQSAKAKPAAKIALPKSDSLSRKVLLALRKTATLVGGTLGPYGRQVLIERPESGLKPFTTKDGVTVHKSIGFEDSIEQVVLESARDAAVRTAQDAGDGTTTATILSYAIAKTTSDLTANNKKCPPQRVVREINALVPQLEAQIKELSSPVDPDHYYRILHKVATLSANGDSEMASVIMEAYDLVGDQGNITITEEYGNSAYKVDKFEGFTIEKGYEESCENFYSVFINDNSNSRIFLEKPIYILFDGNLNDTTPISHIVSELDLEMNNISSRFNKNIVIFAHSFSKNVLATLAHNFAQDGTFKIVPCLTTQSIILNSRSQFLHDVAAFTGAKVWNPMSNPIMSARAKDLVLGLSEGFEAGRYRSTIIGTPDPSSVEIRVQELQNLIGKTEAVYDRQDIEIRIGKLTCGIAKVKIIGPSQVEIREKKDRAEDAWCAIRSAVKHGTLPGGGWTLAKLSDQLSRSSAADSQSAALAKQILAKAFLEPIRVLYGNAGFDDETIEASINALKLDQEQTLDVQSGQWVKKEDLLDSAPAVLEAIRNSISIATLLGTLGGVVIYKRDASADQEDARSAEDYNRAVKEGDSSAQSMFEEDLDS
jgi:chaperonin GroEL